MTTLTFVTISMGRLGFLQQTVGRMIEQPDCEVIVVDYSCPDGTGDWVEANHPRARVVRVPGRPRFCLTAARNAGARAVQTPWICFVDADIILNPAFSAKIIPMLQPKTYYRPHPNSTGISGTFLCMSEDYEQAGGWDEVIQNYGDEDIDSFYALQFVGAKPSQYPAALVEHIPHGDELRTEFYDNKTLMITNLGNRVYRMLKWELIRLSKKLPSVEQRQNLYDTVAPKVTAAFQHEKGKYDANKVLQFVGQELSRILKRPLTPEDAKRLRGALFNPLG